jgi:SpoVK/Ycf46/Vps4 family AAA+-type ATPase
VVCATNHPELLDRAVWRRFQLRIELPLPDRDAVVEMYRRLARTVRGSGFTQEKYVDCMLGRSMSEIEQFNLDVKRRLVLSRGSMTASEVALIVLSRWCRQQDSLVENERVDARKADRSNSTRAKARKAHPREKAADPTQADLPGTS